MLICHPLYKESQINNNINMRRIVILAASSLFAPNCCLFNLQGVEEILELLKSTWRVLGITETMHYTCYAWVLFRQVFLSLEFLWLQGVMSWLLLLSKTIWFYDHSLLSQVNEECCTMLLSNWKKYHWKNNEGRKRGYTWKVCILKFKVKRAFEIPLSYSPSYYPFRNGQISS